MHAGTPWLCAAAFALLASGPLGAQSDDKGCTPDTMIVFDASGSMGAREVGGETRIELARRALNEILPEITAHRRTGLMTYSGVMDHQAPPRCGGITVRVPVSPNADLAILDAVLRIEPFGLTPLTAAVQQAAVELDVSRKPGAIILITDGIESCGRAPCMLARQLAATAPKLKVHVIGYFLGPEQAVHVACLAEQTDGLYVPVQSFDDVRRALREVTRCKDIS